MTHLIAITDPPTTTRTARARLVLVDDHPVVRQGLAQCINQEADLEVVGEAERAEAAIHLIEEVRPDLVLVDISLQGMSGLELIKRLKARFEDMKLLVLSMHEESLYAERALRAGAGGYIMKQEAPEKVVMAVRRVLSGEVYLSEKMSSKMLQQLARGSDRARSPIEQLSDRELEVFQLVGQGRGTREIAEQLHLSIKTIETYRANIKQKLNLRSANELVLRASQWVQQGEG